MNPEIHYNLVLRVSIAGPYFDFFAPSIRLSLSPFPVLRLIIFVFELLSAHLMCVTNLIIKLKLYLFEICSSCTHRNKNKIMLHDWTFTIIWVI